MLFNPEEERAACGVGFVVNAKGLRSNNVLRSAQTMLGRMDHRGACSCDENTGDGAGVMTGIPHELYTKFAREANKDLPPVGQFATGLLFVREQLISVDGAMKQWESMAAECQLKILFWRMADVNHEAIGEVARSREPVVIQIFIVQKDSLSGVETFRRQIYLLRKYASHQFGESCYICSLSADEVVYKGMFTTKQLWSYYADLQNPDYYTHFAMVHNRFSTNTLPSWCRAHPQRMIAHNGEINTLRGNVNYCRARQSVMESSNFPQHLLDKLFPIIEAGMSDSGSVDNLLEFLYQAGDYSLPEAVMMMLPEAWHNVDPAEGDMPQSRWDFYKWAANSLEPWDGPALIVFSDGRYVGAVLDRNGLRPARYYATDDDMVYMSSEVGVVDIPDGVRIVQKGRLKAGRLLIVDTQAGALTDDEKLKQEIVTKYPYGEWLSRGAITLPELHTFVGKRVGVDKNQNNSCLGDALSVMDDRRLPLFGFNPENISMLILPMLNTHKEPLGSMGNDTPLACLSEHNPHVFDYFQQLFAQVTNPPIDPFRERVVMTLNCPIGPQQNILIPCEAQVHRLWFPHPILSLEDMSLLRDLDGLAVNDRKNVSTSQVLTWHSQVLDATFACPSMSDVPSAFSLGAMLHEALERMCKNAERMVRDGSAQLLIISDRAAGSDRVPIPSLLALGAVHQHLLRQQLRMQVGLVVESGEAKEVHHFCTLIGFGADGICPYLLFESIARLDADGLLLTNQTDLTAVYESFTAAVQRGIFKVMAKMGISTLHSYKSAQIFEAVGLAESVISMCFNGAASRIGGADFDTLARETYARHTLAYPGSQSVPLCPGQFSNNPGIYHWRHGGEQHMNDPESIATLQAAARNNSRDAFKKFTAAADRSGRFCTLRGQFDFCYATEPIPVDSVESVTEIVKRFSTGAMSLGSISSEAHSALAIAMNRIGARSNTGEGGERPERYLNSELRSSIKQVASARFGVNSSYLAHADMLQIKMAQGAKPGEGGELPGYKVTEEIARTRNCVPGVGLISPPPHHDIYSIEDLSQLIYDLKAANPLALISVKLVSEVGVGVIAAGVAKARAMHITISGHDGGTGASSWTGIKHAGLPWELGIAETHQILVNQRTRSRVLLQVDGQIRTGRDVIVAALLGADEFAMSTAPLIVLGCTMMRKCHLNTCPVGIATQDPVLRAKFAGYPEHVVNYLFLLAEEVRDYMSRLGVRRLDNLIGRTEFLQPVTEALNYKTAKLDLTSLLYKTEPIRIFPSWKSVMQEDDEEGQDASGNGQATTTQVTDNVVIAEKDVKKSKPTSPVDNLIHLLPANRNLDITILGLAKHLIETPEDVALDPALPSTVTYSGSITNEDRTALTTLSYAISMQFAEKGLPAGRELKIHLTGSAGQSFCAFLVHGVSVRLEGDANDYVAKGLSGGQVTIVPPRELLAQGFKSEANLLVGNVCLYGATAGLLFLCGQAAERFCVRNSGATVVAEGVGDHGCEYMTGGRAVILGRTGRNFAAGMSGGLAFVYDTDGLNGPFRRKCNGELVDMEAMTKESPYATWLHSIITQFTEETESKVGEHILRNWSTELGRFILVIPREYRRILEELENKSPSMQEEQNRAGIKALQLEKEKPQNAAQDIEDMLGGDHTNATKDAPLDKTRGFVKYPRTKVSYRAPEERVQDWDEVHGHALVRPGLRRQAARCMDCGVPFCQSHVGCPLGNLIPNWNTLVFKDDWYSAYQALAQTNNFPELTGRVCPAPCEGACVLGINADPVTIKHIECAIADKAWQQDWVHANYERLRPPTGRRVVVVGSGPSGLACADQLNKAGHEITVVERRDRLGGLLRYGIPSMKLDRSVLDKRIDLMANNGIKFICNVRVGGSEGRTRRDLNADCQEAENKTVNEWTAAKLLSNFDAIVLCLGATWPRDLPIPGRHLDGIHFAMSFLERWQRKQQRKQIANSPLKTTEKSSDDGTDLLATTAKGKRVAILGGGDTGVDCMATSLRQGALSIVNLELLPRPPPTRDPDSNPWPENPRVYRLDYGHTEVAMRYGRDPRQYNVLTKEFIDNGHGAICGLRTVTVEWNKNESTGSWKMQELPGTEAVINCDLVLLALGFLGPEEKLLDELAVEVIKPPMSVIATRKDRLYTTPVPRVYAAGDCRRGQSLVVHAINEGRQAAREVDLDLMGGQTPLPGPGGIVRSMIGTKQDLLDQEDCNQTKTATTNHTDRTRD